MVWQFVDFAMVAGYFQHHRSARFAAPRKGCGQCGESTHGLNNVACLPVQLGFFGGCGVIQNHIFSIYSD
jgi:hypothetical protein